MALVLLSCPGGSLVLPDLVLVDRADGGHLVVDPPRTVWDRSALDAEELRQWSALVAAAGAAMLEALPVLTDGCLNYWDAGNWALHVDAEPHGTKTGPIHRRLHLHLLGRSPESRDPDWRWGESPRFPAFADRNAWATAHTRLTADECVRVVAHTATRLSEVYGFADADLDPRPACASCGYPGVMDDGMRCPECQRD
ncbi:MAG: hypothetical protein ACREO3_08430 [Arenimonas sp.]